MGNLRLGPLLRYLRRVSAPDEAPLSDRQLLRRFAATHDQAAFAALVERHGGLVAGVCRRLLRDGPNAEDVFQATFLVLARKAASIDNPDALAGWLFGVALRLARKLRSQEARRAALQPREVTMPHSDPTAELARDELRQILDEELGRLPDRYRNPLVLCYLEGKSRNEVAQQLGWSEGAVKGKLERGRELLRGRLTRRGLALSPAVLAGLLEQTASAAVPAGWAENTVAAATLFVAGQLPPSASSALAETLLRAMATARLQLIGAVLAVSFFAVAAGAITHWALAADSQLAALEPPALVRAAEPQPPEARAVALDQRGDVLPLAAVARLGTERLHHAGFGPVAFARDGKILSLGVGGLVLWDMATGKELRQIERWSTGITCWRSTSCPTAGRRSGTGAGVCLPTRTTTPESRARSCSANSASGASSATLKRPWSRSWGR
jgi:RNA polymerase sigma factor (sigma-70 family)